ncbi:MAG: heavy-metal-associated domain-containing protein, partial [Treponemataceae bacterium]|nr:heavy-metal-associated domain-containing protein [Treponemataceae bacterium]
MEKYSVSGMSCAACVARVEKAVSKVEGVSSCTVSLLTNSMGVEGQAKSQDILKAVEDAGYKACKLGKNENSAGKKASSISEKEELLKNKETPLLIKRLCASLVFLLLLMYLSMGYMMWNWPLPAWFSRNGQNFMAVGIAQMILSAI